MFDLTPFRLLGHAYRIRDIPERDGACIWQGLHAVSPHLLVMAPAESDDAIEPFVQAVAAALWKMSVPDRPLVVSACLANIERRHLLRWRPLWDRTAGRLLFDDITVNLFTTLAVRVLCRVVVERACKPRFLDRLEAV